MFGCYRKGDANDPEIYVAAVTAVLARYQAEIVQAVTDPFDGLPSRKKENGYSGLPDVADVKEACEDEANRLERIASYASKRVIPIRGHAIATHQGAWATIKVPPNAPQYEKFREQTRTADVREWEWDGSSLIVSISWFDGNAKAHKLR